MVKNFFLNQSLNNSSLFLKWNVTYVRFQAILFSFIVFAFYKASYFLRDFSNISLYLPRGTVRADSII